VFSVDQPSITTPSFSLLSTHCFSLLSAKWFTYYQPSVFSL
jgi:hypothetical protein